MPDVTIEQLFKEMVNNQASDLYLTVGCAPTVRLSDRILAFSVPALTEEDVDSYIDELLDSDQKDEFETTMEYNTAVNWDDRARFRINVYMQQQKKAIVIRRIQTDIPSLEDLSLPSLYGDLILMPRGLILMVGPTGSGKSTSLAAMIGHRNTYGSGHIITIEDPIEYVHKHNSCIVSQRDVGIDTYSYGMALKNALRQRPDVVLIGEIRDRETMEHAINFAETGHLCLATLHANNANQAIERVVNFFPEEKQKQVLLNLSLNVRAILSQRLITSLSGSKVLAKEIMLNRGLIKNLIEEGKVKEIKEMIERGRDQGMVTFDQSLFDLVQSGQVDSDLAISEADNPANLRLMLKQATTGRTVNREFKAEGAPPQSGDF